MVQPLLIVHGGAGQGFKSKTKTALVQKKIESILEASYPVLKEQGALEAAVYAVRLLEDDPHFNAGTGARIQADGKARLSASVMDGKRERFGAVINLEHIQNPVLVAKMLLDEKYRVLSDEGALRYALSRGLKKYDPRTPESLERWKKNQPGTDTVGACALDADGHLASATSTGGRGNETPGRVSDSPMPVACYATSQCALSATGIGEEIIEQGLALRIATRVQDGMPLPKAFQKTFAEVRAQKRNMGAVGIGRDGSIVWDTSTSLLIYGWKKGGRREIF